MYSKTALYLMSLIVTCLIGFSQTRVTLETQRGKKYENVRVTENAPDLVVVIGASGVETIRKSDLTPESRALVGYDKAEADAEIEKKRVQAIEYEQHLKKVNEEAEVRRAAAKARQLELDRLAMQAAVEAAKIKLIEDQRRYAAYKAQQEEAQRKREEQRKAMIDMGVIVAQQDAVEDAERQRQQMQQMQNELQAIQAQQRQMEAEQSQREWKERLRRAGAY